MKNNRKITQIKYFIFLASPPHTFTKILLPIKKKKWHRFSGQVLFNCLFIYSALHFNFASTHFSSARRNSVKWDRTKDCLHWPAAVTQRNRCRWNCLHLFYPFNPPSSIESLPSTPLSNADPSYFAESLQGHDHGYQRFQSPTRPPYQTILSRFFSGFPLLVFFIGFTFVCNFVNQMVW